MSATENEEKELSITRSSDSNTTSGSTQVSISAPNLSSTQASDSVLQQQEPQQYQQQSQQHHRNGSTRRGLVHSVSIIVEPAMADGDDCATDDNSSPSMSSERRNTIAGPIVLLEDFPFGERIINLFVD
jgi:hypothetical protein